MNEWFAFGIVLSISTVAIFASHAYIENFEQNDRLNESIKAINRSHERLDEIIDHINEKNANEDKQFHYDFARKMSTIKEWAWVPQPDGYKKVLVTIVNYDIPGANARYYPTLELIEVEAEHAQQKVFSDDWIVKIDGIRLDCSNSIWHELKHAEWEYLNNTSKLDHILMSERFYCW